MTLTSLPLTLAGPWQLDGAGDFACAMAVPGDVISALHDAALIPDPYWGRNEYDLRWICERDWTISREFELAESAVDLVASGLDTLCTVRLNGQVVLETANAFRSYRADLSAAAKPGRNTIEITFHATPEAAAKLQAEQPFPVPNSANCPIPNGNLLRKPACDYGWDWNIALAPMGVLGDLRIEAQGSPRIDTLAIEQIHGDGWAQINVTANLTGCDGQDATFDFAGQSVSMRVRGGKGFASLTVQDPALWWPVGLGEQPLHTLTVSCGGATATRQIGLRKMELVTEPDDIGLGFTFRVNGFDVFCRGANWIPADALPGRIDKESTRDLLQSAVDANMNMIRIWGGGRYEPDWFYDMCDEMGLLIWQDFMFACNIYPSTPDFLSEVDAEVRENTARLHHHACLAVWCGDNELVGALTWYDVTRNDRDRYLVNYDRLNRCIEAALRDTDPTAIWWPSSPTPGPMSFGDAWHDDGSGDMHFWSVWHEGRDFDHYRDVAPRFCSEFGFQSYPSMNVIRQFADPADFNIAAPVLESHQKNDGGNARIAETMFRYFRWPAKFEDFVYLSQVQQGLAIQTAVTHWRACKPRCMGTLIWQLNDTWPVCSWSSLDYGGGWKLMHHMAKRFYAPVIVTAVPTDIGLTLRAVNDGREPVSVTVSAQAVNMSGQTRPLGEATVQVGQSAIAALHIGADKIGDDEMLAFSWTDSTGQGGQDIHAPRPFKTYDLQPAGIESEITQDGDDWILTLQSSALALFVSAEADVAGRFSDNAFGLLPGQPKVLRFTPADPQAPPTFTLRDLHSATYN
ncbi:glycosyl hydrolase 2 galactose-binding domain-containing protein [Flavimaricola marinus]|uniref:beta-mannosidase n=1 Tax=Flavimaricola marinus TaxID=1819565 RepID=A0A238LGX1_9RHOB|nr:glycoside hydrolase family 2 protein [Flavimaricola marinus]SMY08140.1 Exo-beta-D-glucosaminidase precursor [Flavimaricola marinus]